MGSYELRFKQSVAKDLRQIPKAEVARILQRVETLKTTPVPAGAEKLSGQNKYRIRQGVYRILYEIRATELVITVVKIAHRREVYRAR